MTFTVVFMLYEPWDKMVGIKISGKLLLENRSEIHFVGIICLNTLDRGLLIAMG